MVEGVCFERFSMFLDVFGRYLREAVASSRWAGPHEKEKCFIFTHQVAKSRARLQIQRDNSVPVSILYVPTFRDPKNDLFQNPPKLSKNVTFINLFDSDRCDRNKCHSAIWPAYDRP